MCSAFDETIVIKIEEEASFGSNVLAKAYENGLFYDVTLHTLVDSIDVPAHRSILIAATDYFATMFSIDMKEKNQSRVEIDEVTGEALDALVRYFYTGKIEINAKNVVDLLASADMLLVKRIKSKCAIFLERQFRAHQELSIRIHPIAERHSLTDLAKISFSKICENFNEMSKLPDFKEIELDFLEKILGSNESFDATEDEIFEAAMKWIDYDKSERQQFVANILKAIRLPLLSSTFLVEVVQPMCETFNCSDLIQQVKKRATPPEILVVGSNSFENDISMQSYCFRTRKWTWRGNVKLTQAFSYPQLAVVDENVYVVDEKVFRFNLRNLKVWRLAPIPTARFDHRITVVGKHLYVFGGKDPRFGLTHAIVERYDIERNKWNKCASMLHAREGSGVAVLGDYIYVIGGAQETDGGFKYHNSVERYCLSTGKWSMVKSTNLSRHDPGVGVLNGKIFVVGGDGLHASVERYDPDTNTWTMLARIPKPQWHMAVAIHDNKLFTIGGIPGKRLAKHLEKDSTRAATHFERYNESEDAWTAMEPMIRGVESMASTIVRW